MKKIILFAVLLAGSVALTHAQCTRTTSQAASTAQVVSNDNFKEVAPADLNAVVQAAVKALAGDTFNVKKIEFNEEKGLTKVTLTNKADATEKCVILDKDGKEVKADSASTGE